MINVIYSANNIDIYHYRHEGRIIDITEHQTKIVALSILVGILTPFLLGIGGYLLASRLLTAHYKWKKIENFELQKSILKTDNVAQKIFFEGQPTLELERTGGIVNGGNTCYIAALLQGLKQIPYFWNYLDESKNSLCLYVNETSEEFAKRQALRSTIKGLFQASFKGELITAEQINAFRQQLRAYDSSLLSEGGPEDSRDVWFLLSKILDIPEVVLKEGGPLVFNNRIALNFNDFGDFQDHLQKTVKLAKVSPILAFGIEQFPPHDPINPPAIIEVACEGRSSLVRYQLASMISCDGHTTVHLKNGEDGWVFFDDDLVLKVSEPSQGSKQNASLVLYQVVA